MFFLLVVVAMRFFWGGWDLGNCWCKRPVQYLSFARRSCCAMHFWRIPMLGWTGIKSLREGLVLKKTPAHSRANEWIHENRFAALVDTLTGLVSSNIRRIRRFTHPGCFAKIPRTCWPIWEIQFVATLEVTVFLVMPILESYHENLVTRSERSSEVMENEVGNNAFFSLR